MRRRANERVRPGRAQRLVARGRLPRRGLGPRLLSLARRAAAPRPRSPRPSCGRRSRSWRSARSPPRSLADLALLAVQAFAIHAFCKLCILTYVLGGLAFAALFPARRAAAAAGPLLARPEGRLALAGAVAGALAILAFVFAANTTLRHRAAARTAGLLGAPAPVPACPAPRHPTRRRPPLQRGDAERRAASRGHERSHRRGEGRRLLARAGAEAPGDARRPAQARGVLLPRRSAITTPRPSRRSTSLTRRCADRGGAGHRGRVLGLPLPVLPAARGSASGFVPQAGGRIKIYFKNFPADPCNSKLQRSTHTGSCALALGGICAQTRASSRRTTTASSATELHERPAGGRHRLAGRRGWTPRRWRTLPRRSQDEGRARRAGRRGQPPGNHVDAHRLHRREEAAPNQLLRGGRRQGSRRRGSPPLAPAGH